MSGLRNYMDLMQDYCISSLRCNEGKSHSDADAKTEPPVRFRRHSSESDIRLSGMIYPQGNVSVRFRLCDLFFQ